MNAYRNQEHHLSTSSKRGEALARKVRKLELDAARAKEKEREREIRKRHELHAKARRRSERGRPRAVVREGEGERTLVFRGPHTTADLWIITSMVGSMVVLPLCIGLFFVHWLIGLSVTLMTIVSWSVYVYSPVLITVTDNGYFYARRPYLPWRDVGTLPELVMETGIDRHNAGGFYRYCNVESKRWKLWTVRDLTVADERTIEDFHRSLVRMPRKQPHQGGYRRAA